MISRASWLNTDAKTLYSILLDRMGLSAKNGWLDGQGRVYIIFPVQEVMDALGCADNKATKLFRELEKFGLIERKRRGLGKPNLIYVKNFADPRCRNREKNGSGAADSAQQETAKSRGNKTEWNNILVCKMLDDLKKKLQPPKKIAEKWAVLLLKQYVLVLYSDENTCYNIAMAQVSVAQEGKLPEMH